MTEGIDCGRCCCFNYYQDTDDEGGAISAPVEICSKGYKLYPVVCEDFEDCWVGVMCE
nr:hypothetical protein [uncultured Methanobrevibacter sp.]